MSYPRPLSTHQHQLRQRQRSGARGTDAVGLLGVAAATITLAGVGWYWYNRWAASSPIDDGSSSSSTANEDYRRRGEARASSTVDTQDMGKRRPTLSILLSPHFDLSIVSHQEYIIRLYQSLSPLYLVSLIHFDHHHRQRQAEFQLEGLTTGLQMAQVQGADVRRILPYSTREGGSAVARALRCEAHLEIYLDGAQGHATGHSPTLAASTGSCPEQSRQDLLARTQALNLIRRNGKCKLAIVGLLPSLPRQQRGERSEGRDEELVGGGSGVWEKGDDIDVDLDHLVSSLLNNTSTTTYAEGGDRHDGHVNIDGNGKVNGNEGGGATLRILDTRKSTDPTSPSPSPRSSAAVNHVLHHESRPSGTETAAVDRSREGGIGEEGKEIEGKAVDWWRSRDRDEFNEAIDQLGRQMKELRRAWK